MILGVHYLTDVLKLLDDKADEGKSKKDGLQEFLFVLLIISIAEIRQNFGVVLSLVVHRVVVLVILYHVHALDSA
jgi:hypothetical protein